MAAAPAWRPVSGGLSRAEAGTGGREGAKSLETSARRRRARRVANARPLPAARELLALGEAGSPATPSSSPVGPPPESELLGPGTSDL